MFLKKENKHLFKNSFSQEKQAKNSSASKKKALIKILSTSKFPKDFFGRCENNN